MQTLYFAYEYVTKFRIYGTSEVNRLGIYQWCVLEEGRISLKTTAADINLSTCIVGLQITRDWRALH